MYNLRFNNKQAHRKQFVLDLFFVKISPTKTFIKFVFVIENTFDFSRKFSKIADLEVPHFIISAISFFGRGRCRCGISLLAFFFG